MIDKNLKISFLNNGIYELFFFFKDFQLLSHIVLKLFRIYIFLWKTMHNFSLWSLKCYMDSGIYPALSMIILVLHFTFVVWLHSVFVITMWNGHTGGLAARTIIIICYMYVRKTNRPFVLENILPSVTNNYNNNLKSIDRGVFSLKSSTSSPEYPWVFIFLLRT